MMNAPKSNANTEVDMSEEAIDRRLRNVSQLFRLGMAIRTARSQYLGTVEELKSRDEGISDETQPSDSH
jgi:hypothetical protein